MHRTQTRSSDEFARAASNRVNGLLAVGKSVTRQHLLKAPMAMASSACMKLHSVQTNTIRAACCTVRCYLTLLPCAGLRPRRRVPLRTRGQPRRAAARAARRRRPRLRRRRGGPEGPGAVRKRARPRQRLGPAAGGGSGCGGAWVGRGPGCGGPRRPRARPQGPRRPRQALGVWLLSTQSGLVRGRAERSGECATLGPVCCALRGICGQCTGFGSCCQCHFGHCQLCLALFGLGSMSGFAQGFRCL